MNPTEKILREVALERTRQEQLCSQGKFPATAAARHMPPGWKLGVLGEEVGEVSTEAMKLYECQGKPIETEKTTQRLREELIQVAAVAVAWVESLEPVSH